MVKNLPANAGDLALIPGLGRSPGEENGKSLQYSCLENPMDRGAWWTTYSPWGRKELDTTERLWASLLAQLVKNLPVMQETLVQFLSWEDPLEKG